MERLEVVARTAVELRARHQGSDTEAHPSQLIDTLCKSLELEYIAVRASDVMLGGAYSRLQLFEGLPDGVIWLRDDLDAETRIFAIAHELGHYMLHRGEGISLHSTCDQHEIDQQADPADLRTEERRVEEYTPRARRELEANAFAAELLAPRAHVRRLFAAERDVDATRLAAYCGISRTLAQRRLVDALLSPTRPAEPAAMPDAIDPSEVLNSPDPIELLGLLDASQHEAARTTGPALVIAGPGTGKTATLVGRAAHLIRERNIPPERMLALTFSNRAAGEMRERLVRSGLPGERIPVMTIHAFAVSLLREYASRVPHAADEAELKPEFRILDEADAFLLMEELLAKLPLHYYRSLGNPTVHIHTLLADFSRARDGLLTPTEYLALVEAMPLAPSEPYANATGLTTKGKQKKKATHPPAGTFTAHQIARARERAAAYAVWDRELRQRGLVDFGGLIQRAVELLRTDSEALAHVRDRYREILVDEFQDTNRAAAELLFLVAGTSGRGLWVVGDHNQSIYRFRGASPHNLPRLADHYPHLHVLRLRQCYRSVPNIVRLGSLMAQRMAALATANGATAHTEATVPQDMRALYEAMQPLDLEPVRGDAMHPAIRRQETFVSAAHERVGLAAAIQRHRALGYAYGDQAVLCRTHKQVRQIATVLAAQGMPVSQTGDFFERPEVKDALMLVSLAAGPDARGILRAAPLLIGLVDPLPPHRELAIAARALAKARQPLPGALQRGKTLAASASLSATTRAALAALGDTAMELHTTPAVGERLAAFLLRPQGYTWRLVRIADGLDTPDTTGVLSWVETPARAQQALAALGELVRLARRFDARWLQEPDFRARLSRAVTHRRAPQPAQPDALEPVPGADVVPMPLPAPQTQPSASAPAVRCFLHYLAALRATDVSVPIPAGEADAVHLLTLHQSKGLEFPVVILPSLAQGQFPAGTSIHEEACPPGFRESDAPGEREAEERCLFYVGVTRARDIVAFTRATSYSKVAGGSRRTAQPSSLLTLIDIAPDALNIAPLLPDEELARLETLADAYDETGDDEDDDEAAQTTTIGSQPPTPVPSDKPVFPLHDLEQYRTCPRQYKYARRYGLLDPAENAVSRFHRYIRRGAQALRDLHTTAPDTQWPTVEARLQALWETDGPAGHAYDAFYWQAAEAILRAEWQAITTPQGAEASGRVLLAQPLLAELKQCIVAVTADRAITGIAPTADPAAPPLTVLVRLHTGRPREQDNDDLSLPLYYLAHQQQHPRTPVQIVLAYAGGALTDQTTETDEPAPGDLVDVTDIAQRDAEKYLKPDRKRRAKLDKLDEAALGIAAGRFEPHPDERRCASCAYCYVCPADPESPAPNSIPMPQEVPV